MQQNSNDQTLAQGYSNDGNIIDLDKRLFHEKEDTTKRIHQVGYDEIMKFKNTFDTQSNNSKGCFRPGSPVNEPSTAFQQFQENCSRCFGAPPCNEVYPLQKTCQNLFSSGPLTNSDKSVNNGNPCSNCCSICSDPEKPLKPILRNTLFRPECEKMCEAKRQVTFDSSYSSNESRQLFPNLVAHNVLPGPSNQDKMEYSPTYSNQTNHCQFPCSSTSPYCNIPKQDNDFKYHYLNIHSHRIPEEKPQVNCVNNPAPPPPNSYFHGGFNQPSYEQQNYTPCSFGQTSTNVNPNSRFLNSSPSGYPIQSNQFDNDKMNFQPRTQERDTIIFKRDNTINLQQQNPAVFSSQPCYAIPADAAYFYADKFELYINAKLLIPERIKLNILPEKVELYGCTEQSGSNTTSLIEIIRVYDLPSKIVPEQSNCILSPDGILFLTSRWENPFR